jgi:opacity protein-like surface antigen
MTPIMRRLLGSAALLAVVLTAPARAMDTDDPGTVAPKTVEVELSAEHASWPEGAEQAVSLAATTGLLDNLDVGLSVPFLRLDPDEGDGQSGLGDMEAGLKWRFLEAEGNRPALALTLGVTIPVGDEEKGLGSGDSDISGALVAGFEFKQVNLHLNLGYTHVGGARTDEGEKEGVVLASAAVEWSVTEPLAVNAEFLYESKGTEGEDHALAATAGLTYAFSEMVSLDLGARAGLSDTAPDWGLFTTLTMTFGGTE